MKHARSLESTKRCVRVARGVAESNSSFLSALQTSQVLHISMNAQLTHEPIVLQHFQCGSLNVFQGICLLTFSACTMGNYMKHARATEFDYTNLLAML